MKRLVCAAAILGLFLIAGLAWAAPTIKAVDPDKYAGKVYEGQTAKQVFEIRNEGDQVLEIKKVNPG